jgi:uncharacterized protein YjbI with pentapeptide repeats
VSSSRKPSLARQRAELAARWPAFGPGEFRELLGQRPMTSPFGLTTEGLVDMRGLVLQESIRGDAVRGVDFSFMQGTCGQLVAPIFDCKFKRMTLKESLLFEHFERCDFTKANLHNYVFMGKFLDCIFDGGDLGRVRGSKVNFEKCTFRSLKMKGTSLTDCFFDRCQLIDCRFTKGSLGGSHFRDCKFERVIFDDTFMTRVKGIEGLPEDELAVFCMEYSN